MLEQTAMRIQLGIVRKKWHAVALAVALVLSAVNQHAVAQESPSHDRQAPQSQSDVPPRSLSTVEIVMNSQKLVDGWKQSIPVEVTGDIYEISVENRWLCAQRSHQDGAIDWRIVLAQLHGAEAPKVELLSGVQFTLSYQGDRYFIRETGGFLRVRREAKHAAGFFRRADVLPGSAEFQGDARSNDRESDGTLCGWKQADWFFLGLGQDRDQLEFFLRMNPVAKKDKGYGFSSTRGGFLQAFHGDAWLIDDGDLLACRRTQKTLYEAELARERLRHNMPGRMPPAIDAASWLNVIEGLTWEKLRGKVVVLDFWGTWCGPCVKKMPQLQQLAEKYRGRDLVVIGVHSAEGAEAVAEFVTSNNITFPIAIDTGKTAERFVIGEWPTVFLVDKSGQVVSGYRHDVPGEEQIEELLRHESR